MELIVCIAALIVLDLLAMRFGDDSRPSAYSKEQELANFGLSWGEPPCTNPSDTQPKAAFVRFGLFRRLMDPQFTVRAVFRKETAR